jgi:hypothetical protein
MLSFRSNSSAVCFAVLQTDFNMLHLDSTISGHIVVYRFSKT